MKRRVLVLASFIVWAAAHDAVAQTRPGTASAAERARAAAREIPMRPVPTRNFVQIKDDLWRAGIGNWWTLIYVTPEGILLVDPITADFAAWVKAELERRFPGKPVRYIVYSHSHWDHIGGAAVFSDSHPQIVAQERMLKNMDGRFPHFPGNLVDRNDNGSIEPEEMYINTLSHPGICGFGRGTFERADRAHSGHITPPEWWSVTEVVPPTLVYSDRMTILLGGRTIQLVFRTQSCR